MHSLTRHPLPDHAGLTPREVELRARLAAAHLECLELRSELIDAQRLRTQDRFEREADGRVVAALAGQVARLESELNAIRSSRWVRLGVRLRSAARRASRPLPPRVKRAIRAALRRAKRMIPAG